MDIALLLIGGLVALVVGGELLVRGSVKVAERLGLSPLLIGLTLVGFGTSTPELVTSVEAALAGSPGIAIGNVVGSNIANILLILGITALIFPVPVASSALKRDGGVMVAATLLLVAISFVTPLTAMIGVAFLALLIGYIYYSYRQERLAPADGHGAAFDKGEAFETALPHQGGGHARSKALDIALWLGVAVGGLAIVIFGGKLFVDGAIDLARSLSISETVIGLTIVAVGTSMPELVTSTMAALRKQTDIAIGNILGSNIYNILGILGVTGLIAPIPFPPEMIAFDMPVMIGVSLLLVVFAATGKRITRVEGGILLAGYVAYVAAIWP